MLDISSDRQRWGALKSASERAGQSFTGYGVVENWQPGVPLARLTLRRLFYGNDTLELYVGSPPRSNYALAKLQAGDELKFEARYLHANSTQPQCELVWFSRVDQPSTHRLSEDCAPQLNSDKQPVNAIVENNRDTQGTS